MPGRSACFQPAVLAPATTASWVFPPNDLVAFSRIAFAAHRGDIFRPNPESDCSATISFIFLRFFGGCVAERSRSAPTCGHETPSGGRRRCKPNY